MNLRCYECGEATEAKRLAHHEVGGLLGLDSVVVDNLPAHVCTRCASVTIEGPVLDSVQRALALGIVQLPELDGGEVRFLRKFLGYTQQDLASTLDIERITVGRWERGEVGIQGPAAAALRGLVVLKVRATQPDHPALEPAQRATFEPSTRRVPRRRHSVDAAMIAA